VDVVPLDAGEAGQDRQVQPATAGLHAVGEGNGDLHSPISSHTHWALLAQ
jgi:hypothetical protein